MGTDVKTVQVCKNGHNNNNNSAKKKKTQAVQTFSVLTTSSDRHCWDLNENIKAGNK